MLGAAGPDDARAAPARRLDETPAAGGAPPPAGGPAALVSRLREVHLAMLDAVLGGDGLARVAALAADAAGAPVAIVLPRLGAAAVVRAGGPAADAVPEDVVDALRRYVGDRVKDRPAEVPAGVAAEVPIAVGRRGRGRRAAAEPATRRRPRTRAEFLHLAAVACLTEVAVEEAKEEVEQNLRGSFLEDLRTRQDLDPHEVVRRAGRLGCDLSRGAVVLCAELTSDRPRHVVATIAGDYPGALAQHMEGTDATAARVYALLPAVGGDDAPEGTLDRARRLAGAPGPPRDGRAVELLRRPGRVPARDPGGRARPRRPAPERRADPRGHRDGDLPAAVPGPGLAPGGGPLLLRGHRRPARALRRPVPRPTSSGRSSPTSSRTAT